ncbi:hypothetical protein BABINDRAFT_161922 [Babjeviella inositovora NRRL Y-12698]|uniref:Trafficking protein particle complex subunit n=1 Tax=Babjeviella inositovora NRRL Y-12698 TaxID=984486 RepID=A0A1E3QPF5_9ASCO|nr:uncharacterized protein BABINDRAFT_161922 [Babjeviella inositovora NRRL Y-12698]ODQ79530.1 hypothetical protein BABINDRAFT_161922 [Babjeviella inositovora NRRL Y-12698]
MTIYSFWMFDRHCNCIYTREWTRSSPLVPSHSSHSSVSSTSSATTLPAGAIGTVNASNQNDSAKLLFGALFSLRNIANKLGTLPFNEDTSVTDPLAIHRKNSLKSFATGKYRAHFMETALGLYFCILSDPNVADLQIVLKDLYADVYVNHVVKNSASDVDFPAEEVIGNESFVRGVDQLITALPAFA